MLNNPPHENQAAPGSNKILIILLPLSIKQCGQWDNSASTFLKTLRGLPPENGRGENAVNLFLGSYNKD